MKQDYEQVLATFNDIIAHQEMQYSSYDRSSLIEGRIVFITEWTLDFMEFKAQEKHKYRFHVMDADNQLVIRWDTAPHHRELDNAPFHKHTTDGVEATAEKDGHELLATTCTLVLEQL